MNVVDLGLMQRQLELDGFWGEINVKWQNGQIVLVEKKETFKPVEYVKMFRVEIRQNG